MHRGNVCLSRFVGFWGLVGRPRFAVAALTFGFATLRLFFGCQTAICEGGLGVGPVKSNSLEGSDRCHLLGAQ